VTQAVSQGAVTLQDALRNLWEQATATGPGTSHMARVMASKSLLEHFRLLAPPPGQGAAPAAGGGQTVIQRIEELVRRKMEDPGIQAAIERAAATDEKFQDAFERVADREEGRPLPPYTGNKPA
jgi:hypothetical protein